VLLRKIQIKGGEEMKIILQHEGNEVQLNELERLAKNAWKQEGNKMKDIKEIELYIKPEEGMAYFVINELFKGSIPLYEE